MAYPIVNSTQVGPGAGTPGEARDDLLLAVTMAFADTEPANAGATYANTLFTPYDSAVTLTGPTSATPSIVGGPDVPGTYALMMAATIGGVTRTTKYLFAVLQPESQTRIPLLGERGEWNKDGNTRGWDPSMTDFMRSHETVVVDLAAEIVARAAGDTAEASARATAISSEASTRATADTAEASARAAADATEASARAAADTALTAAISAGDALSIHKATSAEISALTAKTLPTKSDKFLGEDAANSHSKIFCTLEDFLVATGGAWWGRPDTASSYDDEFDTNTSGSWTSAPALSGSAIDPYNAITVNPRVDWGSARRSHLTVQPPDATDFFMSKAVTLDTNCWIHARFSWSHTHQVPAGSIMQWFGLGLSEQGNFSAHFIEIASGALFATTGKTLRSRFKDAGGGPTEIQNVAFSAGGGIPFNHVAIQKISTAYYFFGANDRGEVQYCGTKTWAGNTLDNIVLYFFDDGGAPGSSLCAIDFLRYGANQKWPLL